MLYVYRLRNQRQSVSPRLVETGTDQFRLILHQSDGLVKIWSAKVLHSRSLLYVHRNYTTMFRQSTSRQTIPGEQRFSTRPENSFVTGTHIPFTYIEKNTLHNIGFLIKPLYLLFPEAYSLKLFVYLFNSPCYTVEHFSYLWRHKILLAGQR